MLTDVVHVAHHSVVSHRHSEATVARYQSGDGRALDGNDRKSLGKSISSMAGPPTSRIGCEGAWFFPILAGAMCDRRNNGD
jgi:hypothetical protein